MVNEGALRDYLRDRLPGADRQLTIEPLRGGQSNPTFRLRFGSQSYVLRKRPEGTLLPSAHAVDREYRVMSALAKTDVPVPAMRCYCDDVDVIGTPFFVVFGTLSDRIGRKKVVLTGCAIAALTYFPAFKALTHYANPALDAAVTVNPVTVLADPADCSFQFDPVGKRAFANSCDIAKTALAKAGVPYEFEPMPRGTKAYVFIGNGTNGERIDSFDGRTLLGKEQCGFVPDRFNVEVRHAGHRDFRRSYPPAAIGEPLRIEMR